jgi:hypothetical protein
MAALLSPIGRASFPSVFKADAFEEGQEPKFSVTLLFPKKGTNLTVLENAIKEAAKKKWGDKVPKNLRSPIRDGDEKDLDGYADCWFIRFASATRPHVVDRQKNPIDPDGDRFYAGCMARVAFNAYAYDKAGNRGVAFGLESVQKVDDGEPFGARRTDPEEAFDDLPELEIEDVCA